MRQSVASMRTSLDQPAGCGLDMAEYTCTQQSRLHDTYYDIEEVPPCTHIHSIGHVPADKIIEGRCPLLLGSIAKFALEPLAVILHMA